MLIRLTVDLRRQRDRFVVRGPRLASAQSYDRRQKLATAAAAVPLSDAGRGWRSTEGT